MPYIGKTPLTGAYQLCDTITTSATATYNLLVGGSAVIPGAAQNCIVSLNGVIQAPVSAYTVSGSTIVFSSTLSATDVIDFILILGNVFDIGKPTDGSVTNASIANGTINLTTKVTGVLPVANGGTGLTALGTAGQALVVNSGATALQFATLSSGFTSGTAVATTSGTAFDFTGIPSTTKLIILNLHEVSLSGGDNLYVQLGDSGGFETSGYLSTSAYAGASSSYTSATDALTIVSSSNTAVFSGLCFISLVDSSTNTWVSSHTGKHASNYVIWGGGSKSLSDTLTQVRLTRGGSNTFDGGKLNILYI